jgi:hypothetical protein
MKKSLMPLLLAVGFGVSMLSFPAFAENAQQEKGQHPRIAKAIAQIEDAIQYMEAAPHDFGGHRVEAIQASREAVKQLHLALQYRAAADTKKGK